MNTTLITDWAVKDICEGFTYNELEGKGLFGLDGKLTIQPEYQRNYIYAEQKREAPVIDSLLKGYPLGLLYFVKTGEDAYEILDGQQRVTSFGRFVTGKFAINTPNGVPQYFNGLEKDQKDKILNSKLTIYICEGEESEIKEWFKTINIAGIPLNEQELSNAIHSGPFVTLAKEEFSNSQNANIQKWSHYINGGVYRQDYLREALKWVSGDNIDQYMSKHRYDDNINELKAHFTSVIDWVSGIFEDTDPTMRGIDWGCLYNKYHKKPYSSKNISKKVRELLADDAVTNRRGIYEYVLDDCKNPRLLNIRLFDDRTKKRVYERQTVEARKNSQSNCPACVAEGGINKAKIWNLKEMEADHVSAWSKGGATDDSNCQMLCKAHNRIKGNH